MFKDQFLFFKFKGAVILIWSDPPSKGVMPDLQRTVPYKPLYVRRV